VLHLDGIRPVEHLASTAHRCGRPRAALAVDELRRVARGPGAPDRRGFADGLADEFLGLLRWRHRHLDRRGQHDDRLGQRAGDAGPERGRSGTSLVGWSLVGYDGSSRNSYQTVALSGTIPSQQNGFGTRSFAFAGLQNGSPDGMALVNANGIVVQFLSYEGTFTALNGPAAGLTSTDVGPIEGSSTPVGYSLRLTGSGCSYANFAWQAPAASSAGAINAGQTFLGTCP
jgi:hypothetical protein